LKLNIIIAESALELIPDELGSLPAVVNDSKRRSVEPARILLDRSIHHAAMRRLKDRFKRGRPDLVHITLLSITSTPLYLNGFVKVYIHTYDDMVLEIKETTRPPKNYFRFRSLIEKLLFEKVNNDLIKVYIASLSELLEMIRPDLIIGLSMQGEYENLENLVKKIITKKNPAILIGGFAHGHFLPNTLKVLDELIGIDEMPLDAHVVAARLVYELERRIRK
jgi:rRNA small subunit pseudouridine methyltransferase Nep1